MSVSLLWSESEKEGGRLEEGEKMGPNDKYHVVMASMSSIAAGTSSNLIPESVIRLETRNKTRSRQSRAVRVAGS